MTSPQRDSVVVKFCKMTDLFSNASLVGSASHQVTVLQAQAPWLEHLRIFSFSTIYDTGLHPKDGVFPEKVNPGRTSVNSRGFSIGKNPNPASVKFTGISTYES